MASDSERVLGGGGQGWVIRATTVFFSLVKFKKKKTQESCIFKEVVFRHSWNLRLFMINLFLFDFAAKYFQIAYFLQYRTDCKGHR